MPLLWIEKKQRDEARGSYKSVIKKGFQDRPMKLLALEHELPDVASQQFQHHAKDEARKVWELYQAGVIREMYFRADRHEAVLVLESESVTDARKVLSTLPFVQNKLICFEIIPLKAYDGFERLFTCTPIST